MGSRQVMPKEELSPGLLDLYEGCKKAKHEGLTCYRCQPSSSKRFHVECQTCKYNASNHSGSDLRGDSKPNIGVL